MSAAPVIREATEADIPAILAIYNDAVANTTAIWNDNLVDLENRRQWYAVRKAKGFPVLVADRDGEVAGYAAMANGAPSKAFAIRSNTRSTCTISIAARASVGC